jgi:hypothetical protein
MDPHMSEELDLTPGPLTVVEPTPEQTILNVISAAARDPTVDVEKLERLVMLYERMRAQEALSAFNSDLALMQPELPEIGEAGAITDKQGEVQSTYALWEDVQKAIKPVLAAHGFALTFECGVNEGKVSVTAKLSHRLGHVSQTTLDIPLDTTGSKNTVQAYGSSTSYGMRYTARALLNLTSRGEDDDGQAGGVKLISDGEREALELLAKAAKVELVALNAYLHIPSLDQLPARRYRIAERALQIKLKPAEERRQ